MDEEPYVGLSEDLRPAEEKERDWTAEEAYGAVAPVWSAKKPPKGDALNVALGPKVWRRFKRRDQSGGSCVAHSHAKSLGVENQTEEAVFIEESARPIFSKRKNRPASGMSSADAFEIVRKYGTTSEARLPSMKLRDEEMDAPYPWEPEDELHAERYKATSYTRICEVARGETFSIDAVASAIETLKCGVVLHIFAKGDEWKKSVPNIVWQNLTYAEASIKHAVIAVDYTMHKGQKALVIEESYSNDSSDYGQRILTEKFLAKRCRYAAHHLPRPNVEPLPPIPKPALARDLAWDSRGQDVAALQSYLKAKGFFPLAVDSTGLWRQITAQAVRKWQVSKGILDFQSSPDRDVRFGPKSRAALAAE